MNVLWSYFWPVFGIGVIIGIAAGSIAFRAPRIRSTAGAEEKELAVQGWRRRRWRTIVIGALAAAVAAVLWHGPLGAAGRFSAEVEGSARLTLDNYEMTKVTGHLHHGPLTRRLILAGPADDFQTSELVRIMSTLPGVSRAQWRATPAGPPLIIEGTVMALAGFLLGLLLAYLLELRRRHNAQWNW